MCHGAKMKGAGYGSGHVGFGEKDSSCGSDATTLVLLFISSSVMPATSVGISKLWFKSHR